MPCENAALRLKHICSLKALRGARQRCGGASLGHLPSTHSNRFIAEAGTPAERALRAWMQAGLRLDELVPSEMQQRGTWHTPEQCTFGLLNACSNGGSAAGQVYFDWFFTRSHARPCDAAAAARAGFLAHGATNASSSAPPLDARAQFALPLQTFLRRVVPGRIETNSSHGRVLTALARDLLLAQSRPATARPRVEQQQQQPPQQQPPPQQRGEARVEGKLVPRLGSGMVVDACLAFPRVARCPGLLYRHIQGPAVGGHGVGHGVGGYWLREREQRPRRR
jgi:hypothetical protein